MSFQITAFMTLSMSSTVLATVSLIVSINAAYILYVMHNADESTVFGEQVSEQKRTD